MLDEEAATGSRCSPAPSPCSSCRSPAPIHPTATETQVNRDVLLAASPDTCPFDIVAHLEGTRVVTDFTDRNGALVRRVIHLRSFTITYTNPLSGKSLSTPLAGPAIGEPQADGTWLVTVPGNDGRFVIPGQGIVFANVGPPHRPASGNVPARDDRGDHQVGRHSGRERVPRGLQRPRLASSRRRPDLLSGRRQVVRRTHAAAQSVQPPGSGSPIRRPKRSSRSGTVSGCISRP